MRLFWLPIVALAGCGHGPVVAPETQVPPCRQLAVRPERPVPPSVRWFGPGQDDEVVRHFQWCRAVGPLHFSGPAHRSSEPVDSLAIVTYNMNLGAGAVTAVLDSLVAGGFSGGVPIRDYLVLLQETIREGASVPDRVPSGSGAGRARYPAPSAGKRIDVVALAERSGLHLFYSPAMRSGNGPNPRGLSEDRGNAILSTIALEGLTMVELPWGGARRIAQVATVRGVAAGGHRRSLDVANVHFDVGPLGPSALSAIRARQARAMVAVLDSSRSVVLGGDLNSFSLTRTAESVQILRRGFPDGPLGDPAPTRGWQRLDYLFFRLPSGSSASSYVRLASGFGSDHLPLLAWVRFAPPTRPGG